eukprot:CAMPEP_0113301778 /NCGR_PEP_ID=MMETSP0010_2-20120614/2863_1 /TAXON_ID=216773 ORGANISM="Corethron hystrix, Strain 308" /NCGR_SAMPLE_ID=MMETSP0010_2 /ASSEMBLY_ACC=CAM_ASM_000155 /LENGTH=236 /DNA_ID=CAMNT_0000155453 /DNA_START=181 /DNA_END=888 /DNA_ORIENTATION=+ /assembly_acc=CAM_ASM_000155
MPKLKVKLFYDCISPFSCYAFNVLSRYRSIWQFELELKPMLLGGVMAATNNSPPAMRPWFSSTLRFAEQDAQRNNEFFNVALLPMPSNFFGPDGPADKSGLARNHVYMRTLCAVSRDCTNEELFASTCAIFNMIHVDVEARDADGAVRMDESTLSKRLSGILSKDKAESCVAAVNSPDIKELLKKNTTEALDYGAFGAPYMVVSGHGRETAGGGEDMVVFGSDRFEQLAWAIRRPW